MEATEAGMILCKWMLQTHKINRNSCAGENDVAVFAAAARLKIDFWGFTAGGKSCRQISQKDTEDIMWTTPQDND